MPADWPDYDGRVTKTSEASTQTVFRQSYISIANFGLNA